MNINLTLLAQALVFALFIWFTAKFVWPPILRAMDERRKKIASVEHRAPLEVTDLLPKDLDPFEMCDPDGTPWGTPGTYKRWVKYRNPDPLDRSETDMYTNQFQRLGGRIPLVGVGGILDAADACAKIDAGATLVQIYSGMVYRGPALIGACVEALRAQRKPAA